MKTTKKYENFSTDFFSPDISACFDTKIMIIYKLLRKMMPFFEKASIFGKRHAKISTKYLNLPFFFFTISSKYDLLCDCLECFHEFSTVSALTNSELSVDQREEITDSCQKLILDMENLISAPDR